MIDIRKINSPNKKVSLLTVKPPAVIILFPLFPQYNSTAYELLPRLNILKTQFDKLYVPIHNKNIYGVKINTLQTYEELVSQYKTNRWLKLIKPIRAINNITFFKNLIVDLFPIYYQLSPVFKKYEESREKFWDIWYEIFIQELKNAKEYFDKLYKENKINTPIDIVPILVINPHNDKDLEFIKNSFIPWIKSKSYELEGIDNFENNIYYVVPFSSRAIYSIFANSVNGKFVVNKYSLLDILKYSKELINELNITAAKILTDNELDEQVNTLIKAFKVNILSKIENTINAEEHNKIENFIKELTKDYVEEKQIKIIDKEKSYKLLNEILKEKLNLINVNLDKLTPEDIFEILRRHIIVYEEIIPKPVDKRFQTIYNPDKVLSLKSTITNLHEKEFGERIDTYIRTLLKSLEDIPDTVPLKKRIKNIKRELIDDKLNRFWLYTVTVENEKTGESYDLQIKIPALINQRYFKLNGKTYVLANQRFLKPITVTDKNKARLLTYYAIVTLNLKNYKLSLNDINSLIDYIHQKYPKLIKNIEEIEHPEEIAEYLAPIKYNVEFIDGCKLYGFNPIGSAKFLVLECDDKEVIYDANKDAVILKDKTSGEETELKEKINEYLINYLTKLIRKINPNDKLSTTSKLPYVEIYLGGFKMPYILFLFGNFGIIKSLEKLGIEYEISDSPDKNAYTTIALSNNKYLNLYPDNIKEEYIVNGIFAVNNLYLDKYKFEEFENNQKIRDEWMDKLFGNGAARINLLFRRYMIDPVTKEILKAEGKSTNYFNILTNELLTALFNSKVYKPTDLRIHRTRLSEVVLHILYKQIAQAKHELEKRALGLKESGKIDEKYMDKYYINPDYVIQQLLLGESLLQYTEPVNPIDELNVSTRITPKGIGGLPNDALSLKHRLIPFEKDPKTGKHVTAHFQNISALDTNEYSNVGSNNQLTWTALISDKYGFFLSKYDLSNIKGYETLGIGESLAPYIQSIDHDRTIKMAQQLRQTIPIENPDIPLVASGSEFLIPQIVSQRFAIRAEKNGVVEDIKEGKYIVVKYEDGTRKIYNIMPRLARIKRGIFMPVKLEPTVKVGDKIEKGQILAASQQLRKGIYAYGKNVSVALFTYRGEVYEDGWAASKDALNSFKHKRYKEVIVIVPPDAIVDKFVYEENTPVKFGDILLKFKYNDTLEEYLEQNGLMPEEKAASVEDIEFMANEQGIFKESDGIAIRSPADGVLKEVRIYINGKAPKTIETVWKRMVNKYKGIIDLAKQINGEDDYSFEDTIDTSMFVKGGHTWKGNEFKGALIMFLIEADREPSKGDKFVFRGGNKGVDTGIIELDEKPISEITKIEIDWIHNPLSNIGRKNANFFKEIQIGKIMYFLNKRVKEMVENNEKTKDIKKLVIDVYSNLVRSIPETDESKKVVKNIIDSVVNIPDEEFRQICKSIKDPKHDPVFIWIAVPFSEIKEEDIRFTMENILNIPFLERIYIPSLKAFTERPIAVGFAYVTILEHMPDIMMGFRSRGKYNIIGQGVKGESKEGEKASQSLDTLTIQALLNRLGDDSEVLKEFLTVQADDHIAKNYVYSYIVNNGKGPETYPRGDTGSKELFRAVMYSLGLDPGI